MKNWKHVIYLVCAIQIGAGISMMGIMSFLPLFLSELGITDPGEAAFWAGIIIGVTPFMIDLVMQTQMNFQKYYGIYRRGGTPYELAGPSKLSMDEKIDRLVQEIRDADCVIVGGASGLSAAGGGNFYYENNDSFKKYFGKFEEVYHFNGAFDGMFRHWNDRAAFWAFLATFLHTTLTAPIRAPYHDLDSLLKGKDFFVITTNQDT